MANAIEIPAQEWHAFLPRFAERNTGRPVRLETTVQPGEGEPVIAENRSLLGIDLIYKGSGAPAISVALSGPELAPPELTHVVSRPTHLWVDADPDGLGAGVEIDSVDEGRTLLVFEPERALPEA